MEDKYFYSHEAMKKRINIFLIVITLSLGVNSVLGQDVYLRIDTICNDSVYLNVVNTTHDTLFLFDSYFEYANNVHLHRYAGYPTRYLLSFVPMIEYIGWRPHRMGVDMVVNRGGLDYHFSPLLPCSSLVIHLPLNSLLTHTFYRDFDAKKNFYYGTKFKKKRIVTTRDITIIVAVYKDVQNMNKEWIQRNGVNEDPLLCKMVYDYVVDYKSYQITIDLSQLRIE